MKRKTINTGKKGIQLSQAFGAVLTLVLVAVLVIVAIFLFATLRTSVAQTTAITTVNESFDFSSGGPLTVSNQSICNFAGPTITEGFSGASGVVITANNYTTGAGTVNNATNNFSTSDILLTYTGTWGGESCAASEAMGVEFGNYTSLLGLVGTIIFLGLVIGILVTAFAFGGRRP